MNFVLQLNLQTPLELSRHYEAALLFICGGFEDERDCTTCYGDYGANKIILIAQHGALERTPAPIGPAWPRRNIEFLPDVAPEPDTDEVVGMLNVTRATQLQQMMDEALLRGDDEITIPDDWTSASAVPSDTIMLCTAECHVDGSYFLWQS